MNQDPHQLYRELIRKVDEKFAEIADKHPGHMQCRQGCFQCCTSGLSVSPIEEAAIAKHLRENPLSRRKRAASPHYCVFLSEEGGCLIYAARPVICRSHGVPVKAKDEKGRETASACELNFTEPLLDNLDALDFINLDQLNTILALINKIYAPEAPLQRVPLERLGE